MNGTAILKTKRWGHCNPQASKMAALMTLRRWTSQSVGNDVAELGLQNPEFGLDEMVSSQASPKKTNKWRASVPRHSFWLWPCLALLFAYLAPLPPTPAVVFGGGQRRRGARVKTSAWTNETIVS